jgi:hypothetical protein
MLHSSIFYYFSLKKPVFQDWWPGNIRIKSAIKSRIPSLSYMGQFTQPAKVKLIIGFLGRDHKIIEASREILQQNYGSEEELMPCIPFTWTNYYEKEIGSSPLRSFVSYEQILDRETGKASLILKDTLMILRIL